VTPGVTYAFSKSIVENGGGMPAGACGANGVVCNVDAKLEGLANISGSVETFVHALRPGSPALDAGDNTAPQRSTSVARPSRASSTVRSTSARSNRQCSHRCRHASSTWMATVS
jgi:hypothetical protein